MFCGRNKADHKKPMTLTIRKIFSFLPIAMLLSALASITTAQAKSPQPDLHYRVEVVSAATGVEWRVTPRMVGRADELSALTLKFSRDAKGVPVVGAHRNERRRYRLDLPLKEERALE